MEDEIDLREYVRVLLRGWKLIVALTVLGGLLAGAVSFLMPEVFEATALVSVAQPRYSLRLEGVSQGAPVPVKAYPDLALSDDIVSALYAEVKADLPAGIDTLAKFEANLKASAATDPTLLRLTVNDPHPEHAAQTANIWARLLTERAGQLYAQDNANLITYQTQLAVTKNTLDQAEQALAGFQSSNQADVFMAQLDSQQAILTDYLNRTHQFDLLIQGAQDLQDRLGRLDPVKPADPADDVSLVLLTAQSISGVTAESTSRMDQAETRSGSGPQLQMQIVAGQATPGRTVADQQAAVKSLLTTLQVRVTAAQTQVALVQPKLLELQGQLAEAKRQESELTRARDLAQQQYLALAGKIEEAKIAVQETANIVQIASEAATPTERISPRRSLNVALGVVLGGLLGVLLVWARAWWRAAVSLNGPKPDLAPHA